MKEINHLLAGNDLRSLGKSSEIISLVNDQKSFDKLFENLYSNDRTVIMKTIDVIEKITSKNNVYLQKHKLKIMDLSKNVKNIELKWHLAQLLGRLKYRNDELKNVWKILKEWLSNSKESKIVRVNSLQTLYEIAKENSEYENEFDEIIKGIKKENIPSINARIKKML